jgi:gluconokinase
MNEFGSSPGDLGQTPLGMRKALALVLTGVSGSGKSAVGRVVANRLGLKFLDADDYHSPANKDTMHRGIALTDDDRRDWLNKLHEALRQELDAGNSCVLACSALKRVCRKQLHGGLEGVRFFHLNIDYEVVARRLESRTGHFFEKKLLESQFAILEEPRPNEAFIIDQNRTLAEVVQEILHIVPLLSTFNQPKH